VNPADYDFIQRLLKEKSGLVLSKDKQYLLESRLLPVARKHQIESVSSLVSTLRKPGHAALVNDVVEAMTTNESFFFRDNTPFDLFRDVMLPELFKARESTRSVKIWCAAASTGQEPYSLAMILKELGLKAASYRFDILGTDLSKEVLDKAQKGLYSQFEVQRGLPIQMLLKYFTQRGETWEISPNIRSMVKFRQANLLESFSSFGQFDIIFCRNVLIYFDQATKASILERMAKQMAPDGYMVLGAAETVVGITNAFKPVPGSRGLYQPNVASSVAATPRAVGA
jgi:chemotaxis protein methyltransferase CheR